MKGLIYIPTKVIKKFHSVLKLQLKIVIENETIFLSLQSKKLLKLYNLTNMIKIFRNIISSVLVLTALPAFSQVLYKVEGNGLSEPSYLFGTHHIAPLSVIETFGAEEHFNKSRQVVGEIDMTQDQMALASSILPYTTAPADSTLTKVISPEDFTIINEEFKKWVPMPGMTLEMFDSYKPMVAMTIVTIGMSSQAMPGYNPTEQLDTYFQVKGKENGKKIIPLETMEEQAELLYNFNPISNQAENLIEMLKDPSEAIEKVKELTSAYQEGDLNKMLDISAKEDHHPEFMNALLDKRNADWLTKLPTIMKEAPTFIAVGALHLAGEQGLVEGLRRLGYTVTPVMK